MSLLDSLKRVTTVVADTGDIEAMRQFRPQDAMAVLMGERQSELHGHDRETSDQPWTAHPVASRRPRLIALLRLVPPEEEGGRLRSAM